MSAFFTVSGSGNLLGMFDGNRWSRDREIKITMVRGDVVQLLGREFEPFFPAGDGVRQEMKPLMGKIPALLERLPQAIVACEQGDAYHKAVILQFFGDLGPTLRRIQQSAPTGERWFIVAY